MTSNGMLSSMDLPEGELDQDITMILTRKQTNEVKNQPDKYKYIAHTTTFDFLDYHNEPQRISFNSEESRYLSINDWRMLSSPTVVSRK